MFIIGTFAFYNLIFLSIFLILLFLVQKKLREKSSRLYPNTRVISFLHPFCNDCGGGEKVLWQIVEALTKYASVIGNKKDHNFKINILCGIKDDANLIKQNLKNRFEIDLAIGSKDNVIDIELIRLNSANLIRPKNMFTMLLQIIGQIIFAFEIITKVHSDTLIDTTGLPFTYIVLKLVGGVKLISYVHYPFISLDMIQDIRRGVDGVHSRGILTRIKFFRFLKIFYYYAILFFYKLNGLCVDFAFTNSSWTNNHMKSIWSRTKMEILYPPCSTNLYQNNSSLRLGIGNYIVSCAQFRPEKRQKMQVDIMRKLKDMNFCKDLKLFMIGSIRDEKDKKLFDELQNYIVSQGLAQDIELLPNLSLGEVKRNFEKAKIGLHTMRDEHFGISVIEMMSSGLITIAHKSAGPLNDIIGPADLVGLLAESKKLFC